jgi:hypothetical protein
MQFHDVLNTTRTWDFRMLCCLISNLFFSATNQLQAPGGAASISPNLNTSHDILRHTAHGRLRRAIDFSDLGREVTEHLQPEARNEVSILIFWGRPQLFRGPILMDVSSRTSYSQPTNRRPHLSEPARSLLARPPLALPLPPRSCCLRLPAPL